MRRLTRMSWRSICSRQTLPQRLVGADVHHRVHSDRDRVGRFATTHSNCGAPMKETTKNILRVFAYVAAPWSMRVMVERRWRQWPLMLLATWFGVDGCYWLYCVPPANLHELTM